MAGQGAVAASHPTSYMHKRKKLSSHLKEHKVKYLMLAPFIIFFMVFYVIPVFSSIALSFTYYNMLQSPKWIGLANYRLLFLEDDIFLKAIKNTFAFAIVTGPLSYFLSFFFAWIISKLKFSNAFAVTFYAPSITSAVALGIVWTYIFSGDRYGFINKFLIDWGFIDRPIIWLANPDTMLYAVMFVSLWMSMGSGFLVFLAGLRNVPTELYEAGSIDGIKSKFQQMWHITIPMMKPQFLFGAVNAIVGSFAVFEIALSLTGMPSANYAAHTIVAHLYDYAFIRFELGYASAISVVLFLFTFTLGQICMRLFSSKDQ
jgi:multiple sugar transport system permease protein